MIAIKTHYTVVIKYKFQDIELYISANHSFTARNYKDAIRISEKEKIPDKIKEVIGKIRFKKNTNEFHTDISDCNEFNITRINIRKCIYPWIEYVTTDFSEICISLQHITDEDELEFNYETAEVIELKNNFEIYCNNRKDENTGYMIDMSDECKVVPVFVQKINQKRQTVYICSCNEEKSTTYVYRAENIGTLFFEDRDTAEIKQKEMKRSMKIYGTH